MSIYDQERQLENLVKRIESANYDEENKDSLLHYRYYLSARGLSLSRVIKHLGKMNKIANDWPLNFKQATKNDLISIVGRIEESKLSKNTKKDYKISIKLFFRWLKGFDFDGGNPEITKWIKIKEVKKSTVQRKDLLDENEILKMIEAAESLRDKALIAILADSGARIGEIGNLKIGDLNNDKYSHIISVTGKTGPRDSRLVFGGPYIMEWLSTHPQKNDKNAPLWVNIGTRNRNSPMKYNALNEVIKRTGIKAGIQKRVYPHLFRHTRATQFAKYLTEAYMCVQFGWTFGTDMTKTYLHPGKKDVDYAILKAHGIVQEEEPNLLTATTCPTCKTQNGPTAKKCSYCGKPLNAKEALNIEEIEKLRQKVFLEVSSIISTDPAVNNILQENMCEV